MELLHCPKCKSTASNEVCLTSYPAKYEYVCGCGFSKRFSDRSDPYRCITQSELDSAYESTHITIAPSKIINGFSCSLCDAFVPSDYWGPVYFPVCANCLKDLGEIIRDKRSKDELQDDDQATHC